MKDVKVGDKVRLTDDGRAYVREYRHEDYAHVDVETLTGIVEAGFLGKTATIRFPIAFTSALYSGDETFKWELESGEFEVIDD